MKHQQVVVDYWAMVKTSFTYLALVASFFVLLRMTYAVFTLPRALRRSQEQLSANLKVFEAKIREKEEAEATSADESKGITETPSDAHPPPALTSGGADGQQEPKKEL